MSDLDIRLVDVFDGAEFDAWHDVYLTSKRFGRESFASPWSPESLRVQMQEQGRRRWAAAYLGLLAGRPVTTGYLGLPLLDNLTLADVYVTTSPDHRRAGHATAMLAHLETVAREKGRSLLVSEAGWEFDRGPTGAGAPGVEFLDRRGFMLGLGDVQRELRLPVSEQVLAELAAEAAPHHTAYTLRSWVGDVPEELVESWAELSASLMTEAPLGEMEREAEVADVAVVREGEAVTAKQGRTKLHCVALDAAGEVAAYTDLATTRDEPERAYQWGTLARRSDRGHRLGLAVKVANLQQLQRVRPDVTRLMTYNAEVNEHMIGVNERLGFVPVARLGEFQKRLV